MNKFELHLLYKNETGNAIPELSQKYTYDDEKSNLIEDIKEIKTVIAQVFYSPLKDVQDKISELKDKVDDLENTIENLNSDIDISLDENSRDYIEWLETKIK